MLECIERKIFLVQPTMSNDIDFINNLFCPFVLIYMDDNAYYFAHTSTFMTLSVTTQDCFIFCFTLCKMVESVSRHPKNISCKLQILVEQCNLMFYRMYAYKKLGRPTVKTIEYSVLKKILKLSIEYQEILEVYSCHWNFVHYCLHISGKKDESFGLL